MKDLKKAAIQYAKSLAKMDREAGTPEQETRGTTSIAIDAFIAGAEWQKQEFYNPPKSKQNLQTIERNYCDDCVHFRPDDGGERKPVNELCELVRPLKFKMASTGHDFIFGNDWGFYLPGCKDYKRTE